MGDKSKIEWCDATFNPITGCTPVSAGCANCYASRMIGRGLPYMGHDGPFSQIVYHPDRLDIPLRWKKPRRIFVCSMGDLFHEDVPEEWIDNVFGTMILRPQHTFMILTKRPDRMREYMNGGNYDRRTWPPPHIWLGVTVEDADHLYRAEYLMQTPSAKRFVSVEPCLSNINFKGFLPGLDWVICGGETGAGARFMHPDWPRSLRDQCQVAGVPFFFKGWGTFGRKKTDPQYMMIDGQEWKEFP